MDHQGFSEEICRYFFKQILIGINSMHQSGSAHRDLKPDNIMLTKENPSIKIADFGFMLELAGR